MAAGKNFEPLCALNGQEMQGQKGLNEPTWMNVPTGEEWGAIGGAGTMGGSWATFPMSEIYGVDSNKKPGCIFQFALKVFDSSCFVVVVR